MNEHTTIHVFDVCISILLDRESCPYRIEVHSRGKNNNNLLFTNIIIIIIIIIIIKDLNVPFSIKI